MSVNGVYNPKGPSLLIDNKIGIELLVTLSLGVDIVNSVYTKQELVEIYGSYEVTSPLSHSLV